MTRLISACLAACLLISANVSSAQTENTDDGYNPFEIDDSDRDAWAKGTPAYGWGRVAEGERASTESRENAVNVVTMADGTLGEDDLPDPDDGDLVGKVVQSVEFFGRLAGTLDAQRKDGTLDVQESGLDYVSPKGDPVFREKIAEQGLTYEDHVDADNGAQAILLRHDFTDRAVILTRGTEKSSASWTEFIKDVRADIEGVMGKQLAIGRSQYKAAKPQLDKWVDANKGNVEVIGHSLGGPIGQRLMMDRGEDILYGTFFNSPGLEMDELERMKTDPDLVKSLLTDKGQRKIRIYNAKGDVVSVGGAGFPLADIIMASGPTIDGDPHLAPMFGEDTKHQTAGYYGYHNTREQWADERGLTSDLINTFSGFWPNLNDRDDLMKDVAALEKQARKELKLEEQWQADPKSKLLFDLEKKQQEEEAAKVAALAAGEPDATAGQTVPIALPKTKPKAASPPKPVVKAPVPKKPKSGLVGINGDFEGTMSGSDEDAYISGGRIVFSIAGTQVTGRATGRVVSRHEGGGADSFNLRVTGSYDPEKSYIRAEIRGKVGFFDDMLFLAEGTGGPDGFSGNWIGWFDGQ